jgi:hypothetical protein
VQVVQPYRRLQRTYEEQYDEYGGTNKRDNQKTTPFFAESTLLVLSKT